MCKFHSKIFIVIPVSVVRPSSVSENFRGGITPSRAMKCSFSYYLNEYSVARDGMIPPSQTETDVTIQILLWIWYIINLTSLTKKVVHLGYFLIVGK